MADRPTIRGFPERAILEAAGTLETLIGSNVPLEDYAEVAVLFVEELAKDGFVISRPDVSAHPQPGLSVMKIRLMPLQ
jgi:hypothetical protein